MAIDFSQVKTITIPEGSVTKITDSTGNILWKEKSAGWRTVWSGIQKIGYEGWTGSEFLFATEPFSDTLQIRVTFGNFYTWKPDGDEGYYQHEPATENPVTYINASFSSNTKTLVIASMTNSTRSVSYRAMLQYNKKTGKIYGRTSGNTSGEYARASIVITKIEVYS